MQKEPMMDINNMQMVHNDEINEEGFIEFETYKHLSDAENTEELNIKIENTKNVSVIDIRFIKI